MQQPTVMAFRKRLKKRGYDDVSIKRVKGTYEFRVLAREPLAGIFVGETYSLEKMNRSFRF